MSSTATTATESVREQVTQAPETEGGSPERDLGVDDVNDSLLEGIDMGEEPESKSDDAGDEPAETDDESPREDEKTQYAEQIEELRQEIAEKDEILNEIRYRMDRDPAFRKMLEGGSGASEPENDPVKQFQKAIREGLTPDAAEVLETALSPVLQRIKELEAELGSVKPTMQRLSQKVGSSEFVEALGESGITQNVMRSQEFQRHLKRLRGQSQFQRLESRSPGFAADYAASKWQATKARVNGYRDDRARIESAKNGRGGEPTPRSSALAEKVVRIKRDPSGGHIDRAAAVRIRAQQDGKTSPRIEYYD